MKPGHWDMSGVKILVAEDEEYNFLYVSELLKRQKVVVIRAYNGKMAVDLCTSDPSVQLVLMDVSMPVLDGYEATARIKELRPDLPVIINTSYTSHSDISLAMEKGADSFLPKPVEAAELIVKIKELLSVKYNK